MALDVVNGGTDVIQNVTDYYAYNAQELFLPTHGGTFTINLGATQDEVTHIASLPMRGDLLSVTGDGLNLSFAMVGTGDVIVDLANTATPTVTGATIVSDVGNQLTLSLTRRAKMTSRSPWPLLRRSAAPSRVRRRPIWWPSHRSPRSRSRIRMPPDRDGDGHAVRCGERHAVEPGRRQLQRHNRRLYRHRHRRRGYRGAGWPGVHADHKSGGTWPDRHHHLYHRGHGHGAGHRHRQHDDRRRHRRRCPDADRATLGNSQSGRADAHRRPQPGGDRQRHGRDIHRHAGRHKWPALGNRNRRDPARARPA